MYHTACESKLRAVNIAERCFYVFSLIFLFFLEEKEEDLLIEKKTYFSKFGRLAESKI